MSILQALEHNVIDSITSILDGLEIEHVEASKQMQIYNLGFRKDNSLVSLDYVAGCVSLSIVTYFPVKVERPYNRFLLNESQRARLESWLEKKV